MSANQQVLAGLKAASSAVSGSNLVWVVGGCSGTTLKSTSQTYNVSTGSVASASAVNAARMAGMAGSDNSSKGVISHGYNIGTGLGYTNTTEKITLPGGSWATSATVANGSGRMGGGCSSGTYLFGALSDNPADNNTTNKTEKYTFSADTTAAGSTLSNSRILRSGAHGNSSYAMVPGGGNGGSTTMEKYTYSGDSVSAATALSASSESGYAAGDSTYALFKDAGNTSFTATRKYNMGAQTQASGTALSQSMQRFTSCGSTSAKQLWVGGTLTVLYTFSGDTTANGTAVTDVASWPACFAEAPGGLN